MWREGRFSACCPSLDACALAIQFVQEASSSAERLREKFPPDSRRSSRPTAWQSPCVDARALRGPPTSYHRARGSNGAALNVPRPQLERQDDQRNAKYERKGTKPPGKDHRSGQGCHDHQDTVEQCRGAAEGEPPTAIIGTEGCREHQASRDDRPGGDEQHECKNGDPGP